MVRAINPDGVPHHQNPIPAAAIHNGVLMTSAIMGKDPATGEFPADKADQVALAFRHLERILESAGATPDDVVKLSLYFRDKSDRALVNPHWLRLYPDEAARPARHAHVAELPDGCCLQMEVFAVLGD